MATTTTRMPATLGEHPAVRRQHQRRRELEHSLAHVQADLTRLRTERGRVEQDMVNRRAARLLCDPTARVDDDGDAQLAGLAVEIAALGSRVAPLELALEQHEVIARGVRQAAQRDVTQQIRATALDVVREMVPLVRQLEILNLDLFAMHRSGRSAGLPMPFHPQVLAQWLKAAQSSAIGSERATSPA